MTKTISCAAGLLAAVLVASPAVAQVKKSKSGICHCPGGRYYDRTANFTAYPDIGKCLASGGRHPKRGQGDCGAAAAPKPKPAAPAKKPRAARSPQGTLRVVDGDTIVIAGINVRLQGIDAPEAGQSCRDGKGKAYPCGRRATEALTLLAAGGVSCDMEPEEGKYGRKVGTCYAVGGRNVNALMVLMGYALAYRKYSTAYVREEDRARAGRRGLHSGSFVAPWDWRRGKRLP